MLHRVRWIGTLAIAGLCLAPLAAGAEESPAAPVVKAERTPVKHGWDDSHMRSNHQVRAAGRATRPPIQGASGYGALAAGTSETRTEVPTTLESTTQRDWQQGPLIRSTTRAEQISVTPSGISRNSKLRADAVSGSR